MTKRSSLVRRGAALAALAVLAPVALAACGSDDEAEAGKVRIMMFPGTATRLPVMVAQDQGFFDDEGIELEIVAQPDNLQGAQALKATKSQAGHLSVSTLAQGYQAGEKAAYFCGGVDVLQTSVVVSPKSSMKSVDEGASIEEILKGFSGKKVGVQTPVGSGFQLLFAAALEEAGATDVTYVNIGGANAVTQASLDKGSVDAAQASPPATQFMMSEGTGKRLAYLADGAPLYRDLYGSAWAGPTDWIEEHPDDAQAFCDGMQRGIDFIMDPANADDVKRVLKADTGIDGDVADLVLETYADYSTKLDPARLDLTFETYTELGIIKQEPKATADELVRVLKD